MSYLKNKPALLGYLLLLGSSASASLFVISFRGLSKSTDTLPAAMLLYLFSTLYTLPGFIWKKSWKTQISTRSWVFIGLICITSVLGNYFYLIAVYHIPPSVAQIIQRSDVFIGFFYGIIIFKERLKFSIVIGLALCFIGLGFIFREFFTYDIPLIAIFSLLITAFCFATMQLFTKTIITEISPNTINFLRLLISSVLLVLLTFNLQKFNFGEETFYYAALAAFFGPFGARTLINYAIIYAPFSTINLVLTISPAITVFLQYFLLGLVISPLELAGSLFIFSSIIVVGIFYRG
ncbi:MAG: DMT family transporter [SAR324 cluster bacterium]|nr:DMT family transporter [SAR324 cluster bacterium]